MPVLLPGLVTAAVWTEHSAAASKTGFTPSLWHVRSRMAWENAGEHGARPSVPDKDEVNRRVTLLWASCLPKRGPLEWRAPRSSAIDPTARPRYGAGPWPVLSTAASEV